SLPEHDPDPKTGLHFSGSCCTLPLTMRTRTRPRVAAVLPVVIDLRCNDHRRRILRNLDLRSRLRRPGAVVALGLLRQFAIGGRFDFETAVARQMTGAWIVVADIRHRIDIAAAVDRGLDMRPPQETPV